MKLCYSVRPISFMMRIGVEPEISGVFFGLGDMGWVLLHQGWFDPKVHRYMYVYVGQE